MLNAVIVKDEPILQQRKVHKGRGKPVGETNKWAKPPEV
jgi:hypothetical protein